MKKILLRHYQASAVDAVQTALENGQRHMVVEMPAGCGKTVVLAQIVEILDRQKLGKILVITDRVSIKEQLKRILFDDEVLEAVDRENIDVENVQKLTRNSNIQIDEYFCWIFYDIANIDRICERFACKEKTIIVFSNTPAMHSNKNSDIVFSYTYEDAVRDGFLTPAMDTKAFEPAVEVYGKQLLEQFGYIATDSLSDGQKQEWDLIVNKDNQRIWVEYKTYKSQVVSPAAAVSLLNAVVMKKMKQDIPQKDMVLLLVFSKIPTFQKDEIYKRYQIIVWDIENLVFYSKDNPILLKQLSQITYFPIDYVEGQSSKEAELVNLKLTNSVDKIAYEADEDDEANILINRLQACKSGKKHSGEYEDVCEEILRFLFEANYFNRLTRQHKTKDEHFRMDLIGALKINQNKEESMHPLWQLLVQHHNSHFVVFEFKNYTKEIDQNLIYITEKYLYDSALRNVAVIVSRKGFSKSAKFAAEGCLKEHGKLVFDIKDEDLIEMLNLKSDKAADYLLEKLEEFLMGISK